MKFFIDTANLEQIKEAASYGFLDGVTTNPSLMAKEGIKEQDEHIKKICALVPHGPVSAEVIATDFEGMVKEGRKLAQLADNVAVKLPMTMDGLKATKLLSEENIMVNVTLVFSSLQALLAAKAGAAFVSPFVGRLDDIGHNGMDLVDEIVTIYNNYGFETEIIVASVRHPGHVQQAATLGADIATIPFSVIAQLAKHPLTDKGIAAFLADHDKVAKS